MATGALPSRLLLRCAAATAAGTAVTADTSAGEHPTHTVVLGLVAVAVWALQRRFLQNAFALTTLPAVSAALAAQPALHLTSEIGRPPSEAHDHANLLHIVTSDAPAAGMQVVVPVVALAVATIAARLLYLLINAVRPAITACGSFEAPRPVLVPVRVQRLGSMLRWCGWIIRAARRGPPLVAGHAIP